MNQALANTRHALCIVDALWASGVRDAVVSPGSRNTPLVFAFDAYQRQGRLRVHVVVDERTAGFVALGLARGSARPVALACTSGSAGTHYAPALAEAHRSGLCLIALTADRPQELQQRGAPQTIDQRRLFEGFVREALLLDAPEATDRSATTTHAVTRACVHALAAHQPLHINVGFREPLWDAACNALLDAPPAQRPLRIFAPTATPPTAALDALAAAARGRGLIYVGPIDAGHTDDATRATLVDHIVDAAARLGWPVASDAVAPTRLNAARTLHHADVLFREDTLIAGAFDVVLVVGPWPTAKPFGQWLERHPNVRVIALPGVVGAIDPWHRVSLTVEGAIATALQAVGRCAKGDSDAPIADPDHASHLLALDAAIDEALATYCDAHPAFEGAIARTVLDTVEGSTVVQIASSMPIRDVDTYSRGARPDVFLCASRGVNGIDGLIASVFGTAQARQTAGVLLMGDIAFRHDMGGLMHAAQMANSVADSWANHADAHTHRAASARTAGENTAAQANGQQEHIQPLTIVVVDNAGGGIFRHLAVAQSGERFDPYFITAQHNDLVRLADGAGARAHMVAPEALADTLRAALHRPGVDVLVVHVDADAQVPHRQAAVRRAIDAAHAYAADHAPSSSLIRPTDAP